jgi:hypothetical protein
VGKFTHFWPSHFWVKITHLWSSQFWVKGLGILMNSGDWDWKLKYCLLVVLAVFAGNSSDLGASYFLVC